MTYWHIVFTGTRRDCTERTGRTNVIVNGAVPHISSLEADILKTLSKTDKAFTGIVVTHYKKISKEEYEFQLQPIKS